MNANTPGHDRIRAALYLRISLDATGEQLAIQRQREACLAIARDRGWQVIAEYVDNSVSASGGKHRPGYEALVDAYRRGEYDALLCWDVDRLTRQPRQLEDWIDAATDRGLVLVTANGEADLSTDAGRLFVRIKASVARAEIERKGARQRAAALQRAERGRPPLGTRLTGYTPTGETVPDEAVVITELFARFAAGDSLRALCEYLATTGVPTRSGRPWNPSTVRTILTNPRYAGRAIYHGQTTGRLGGWEPLVDPETFDLVQAKITDPRRRTQVGTDRKHLGAGLYLCGVCEPRETVSSWSGQRYRCRHAHVNRTRPAIDEYVVAAVRERLGRPDLASLLPAEESDEAKQLGAKVRQLRARRDRIADDYDQGVIDGHRYKVATQKVAAELTAAERAHARVSAASGAAGTLYAADPVAAFDAAPLMIRRNVIDALCAVTLYPAPRGRKTFDPGTVDIAWRA